MKSTNNSQETIVKTKNAATTMATFHTRTNNFNDYEENDIVPMIT